MNKRHSCYSGDELRAFGLGMLEDCDSQAIADHLTVCTDCEATLAGFEHTNDPLVQSVRQAALASPSSNTNGHSSSQPESERSGLAAKSDSSLADILSKATDGLVEQLRSTTADRLPQRFATGEQIRDYQLLEPLGMGGMGTVFRAIHCRLDRVVALKTLPPGRLRSPATLARFEREMKAIGRLNHPAIVRATDAGEEGGIHFLAMEFVDGVDVAKLVRILGPLDPGSACEIIRQAAVGLQYAHEQGFVHRDVKPGNLMLATEGTNQAAANNNESQSIKVRILDLGIALFGSSSEALDELTTVGQLMGTLDYMAPEQADSSHDVNARADVYGLGATLFKLLTGTAPFETAEYRTPLSKMRALATQSAPPLLSRNPQLPKSLADIVDAMLQRDPALRIATAADVAASLSPFAYSDSLASILNQAQTILAEASPPDSEPPKAVSSNTAAPLSAAAFQKPIVAANVQTSGPTLLKQANGKGRKWTRWLRWGSLPVAALLTILIWVNTGEGTLTIISEYDDLQVEILRGTTLVKKTWIATGENVLTLPAGSYEIAVAHSFTPNVKLKVEDGTVELSRGSTAVAKITVDETPDRPRAKPDLSLVETASSNVPGPPALSNILDFLNPESIPKFSNPADAARFASAVQTYARASSQASVLSDELSQLQQLVGEQHPTYTNTNERLRRCVDTMDHVLREMEELSWKAQKENEVRLQRQRDEAAAKAQAFPSIGDPN